jgi:hypothetical protein
LCDCFNVDQLFLEAVNKFGKTLHIAEEMKSCIDAAGFINTVERVWKAPIRGWAADSKMKELGHWGLLNLEVGLEGFAMALLTRVMGVSATIASDNIPRLLTSK